MGTGPSVLVVTSATHGHRSHGTALVRAFERAGHPVDHLSIGRTACNRILAHEVTGLRGRDLPSTRRHAANWLQLRGIARRSMERYSVVHVMASGLAPAFASHAGARRARLSIGLDCTAQLMRDEYGMRRPDAFLRGLIERGEFSRADHLSSMSRWAADAVARAGITTPVDVIPPSAPIGSPPSTTSSDRVRIGFVGSPWSRKGGDLLMTWKRQLPPSVELHLVCRDVPAWAVATDGVHVHAPMSRDVLLERFLPAWDLFVFPTRRDQSPWAVAEAACAGLPVVASRMGSMSELVLDGVSGYLVDPGDGAGFVRAIRTLVDDEEVRRAMALAAFEHGRRSLDEVVNFDRLRDRLLELVGERR